MKRGIIWEGNLYHTVERKRIGHRMFFDCSAYNLYIVYDYSIRVLSCYQFVSLGWIDR